ncbi:hypothetical protein KAX97_06790 [candidate division WOR-3 bacterium]|nr:hypothetical protein [candidate division WOR-3 bacterium]
MVKSKYLIYLMLVCIPAYSTILMRNTFEEYEGTSFSQMGWSIFSGGNGVLEIYGEDPGNSYQSQAHGKWSMHIIDPDNSSYANAYKTFSNAASEYMTEFYMWIPVDHAPINSFPLCVLWHVVLPETLYPDYQYKTDIALILDTVDTPPNGALFKILVEDSTGIQFAAYIDSTDRWYKIQIYRHDGVVDFYLDGDSIATFSPLNSNYVSNKIVLGTTSTDANADGEVFYDDVIISTPPVGEHPRLLFEESDLSVLRSRRNDSNSGNLGISYKEMWDTLKVRADIYLNSNSIMFKWPNQDSSYTLFYPFPQVPNHMQDTCHDYWLTPFRKINAWLNIVSFVGIINADTTGTYIDSAKNILNSLANWQSCVNSSYRLGGLRYTMLCTGELSYNMALAYDWLYDYLTSYERMNVQNTLLTLLINQIYLQALYYPEDTPGQPTNYANGRSVIFGGGLGVACLTLDNAGVEGESLVAHRKVDSLLCHFPDALSPDGGFNEGCSYAGFAMDYIIAYLEANNTLNNYKDTSFVKNYPKWRIHCMLPGAENYQIGSSSDQGPN